MTIYATVNSLLAPTSGDGAPTLGETEWTLISPAAVLQGGNPYFVPDFASRFEATGALAVRIGKLGKGIAPRFAARYIDAAAPAALFVASDLLESRRKAGLPWTSALSYDRSLALGRFRPMTLDEIVGTDCRIAVRSATESEDSATVKVDCSTLDIPAALEAISRDNTLKTGDIILLGLSRTGTAVRPDMKATLTLGGEETLRFNIR